MRVTMRPVTKLPKIIIHRKVAAYCRVSTQQEIQHHRLGMQLCCATPEGTRLHFLPLRGTGKNQGRHQFKLHPHPYRMRLQFEGLSHGLKIARPLSIFTPVCALVPPFRVPPARRAK